MESIEKEFFKTLPDNIEDLERHAYHLEFKVKRCNINDDFFNAEQYECELEMVNKKIEILKSK